MGRRLGGLRVAARIARRDAARARGRAVLVALLVGLPLLVGTTGAVLLNSRYPSEATMMRWTLGEEGQALIGPYTMPGVVQDATGRLSTFGDGTVPPVELATYEAGLVSALPERAVVHRVVRSVVHLDGAGGAGSEWVVELPPGWNLDVFSVTEGSLPGPGGLAVEAGLLEQLGINVGDTVTVQVELESLRGGEVEAPSDLVVTGVLADSALSPRAVLGTGMLPVPQVLTGSRWDGSLDPSSVAWYVSGPPVPWDVVRRLNAWGSTVESRAVILDPPASAEGMMPAEGAGIDPGAWAVGGAVAAMVVVEAALLIGPAFAVGALRQRRQFALLAATGAERPTLRWVVTLTGLVTGAAAALGAVVLGVVAAAVIRAAVNAMEPFTFPDLLVPWPALAAVAVVGVGAVGLAAWWPARTAGRVDVVTALAGRRPPARSEHRVAALGLGLTALGAGVAIVGASSGAFQWVAGGVVAIELGVVVMAGTLLGLTGRLAPRLGIAGRMAVRDAARNRTRTAPAVAALIAAVAGITAGVVYTSSARAHDVSQHVALTAEGTVMVQFPLAGAGLDEDEMVNAADAALREHLPVTDVVTVRLAAPAPAPAGDRDTHDARAAGGSGQFVITAEPRPERVCPLAEAEDLGLSASERRALGRDPRCVSWQRVGVAAWSSGSTGSTTLVDDGSVLRAAGLDRATDATAALASGLVVVRSEDWVWPDGTAHLVLGDHDPRTGSPPTAHLPAVAVDLPAGQYDVVLPPAVADALGLSTEISGLVAPTSRTPNLAEEQAAAAALGIKGLLWVERGNQYRPIDLTMAVLVIGALVLGVAATGISVALTTAEARADLATLAAVGADTRTRRQISAAQAAVISILGAGIGLLGGIGLGCVLITAQRYRYEIPDLAWTVTLPWAALAAIAVGIPTLATAVGWLTSPRRLPVTRRSAT